MTPQQVLEDRFGGVLHEGSHSPDGKACALEVVSQLRGIDWTDDPWEVEMPDIRPLNDSPPWETAAQRTEHVWPAVLALLDWPEWSAERQQRWAEAVVLRTILEVLPVALEAAGLTEHAKACREAEDPSAARAAARAADAAARAADAAHAAARAGGVEPLILACRIWREEAENAT